MRYLSISEIFELHDLIISSSGGSRGIRDINALESAVNLPRQTFDQKDLYARAKSNLVLLSISTPGWIFLAIAAYKLSRSRGIIYLLIGFLIFILFSSATTLLRSK